MTDIENPSKELPKKSHKHDELAEVKQLIEEYGKPVATVILVILLGVGAFQIYTTRKATSIANAAQQLATARSIPDFEAVYSNYRSTKSAPRALLALAKLYYDNGNYEIAKAKYDEFLEEFPEDRMLSTAQLGRIFCIEAQNYDAAIEEAAAAYAEFAAANQESFLMPQAVFGQARCYEQLGKLDDARAIYENFIANHGESPWVMRAEDLMEQVVLLIEKQQSIAGDTVSSTEGTPSAPTVEIPAVVEIPSADTGE